MKNNRDEASLANLQRVLLDMMLEVDRICRKHHIKYALIGGTLLGAVRHKGLIPWDDDVDLAMTRSEYERFKCICFQELDADKYFLQDNTTDPHYRWGYARIRRKNSEFVRVGQEHMKMQTGIFIDIFIGDGVPDFYPLRMLHAGYCFALRKVLYAEVGRVTGKNAPLRLIYKLLNIIPHTFVFKRLKRLSDISGPTKYVRTLTFPVPKGRTLGFPRQWYELTVEMEFEGYSFRALGDYDEYLRFKYGDYMKLPPENKRHWHPATVLRLPPEYLDYTERDLNERTINKNR